MNAAIWVRQARRSAGRSQRELAEWTGLPQPTIARIERGQQIPRVDTFLRLMTAAGFEVSISPALPPVSIDGAQLARWQALTPEQRCRQSLAYGRAASALRNARIASERPRRPVPVPHWDAPNNEQPKESPRQ